MWDNEDFPEAGKGDQMTTKQKPARALPWKFSVAEDGDGTYRVTANDDLGSVLCDAPYYNIAPDFQDASYLTHAVNAYPRLVEALRSADCQCSVRERDSGHRTDCTAEPLRALLRELGEDA